MTFGQRLQYVRRMRGMTQAELAEKTGLFQSEISRFEMVQARPSLENIRLLAKALITTSDYLRGRENQVKVLMTNKFGKKLRHFRSLRGMTQKELAERIGLNRSIITYWENGRSYPSLENIQQLAKALAVE